MKKALILLLIAGVIIGAGVFMYRYRIIQYSAENLIRRSLPSYITIERIVFDARVGKLSLGGVRIANPPGFSGRYLLDIAHLSCSYRMKGKTFLDGFDILDPACTNPLLTIERHADGRMNLFGMGEVVGQGGGGAEKGEGGGAPGIASKAIGSKQLSDLITLPDRFSVTGGKVIFIDRSVASSANTITLERIDAVLSLIVNPAYTAVLKVGCEGSGILNGKSDEVVRWAVSLDPTTPKLTMSNRIDASNLTLKTFEPYYDRYSPFVFKSGRFSGTLVFDFDNGMIGSMNEIRLSDYVFYIKRGYENAAFWQTNVQDLARYFTSSFGEIVFDFKIKGDMADPKFFLGPKSKEAVTAMAIDKISTAIESASGPSGSGSAGASSDIGKAKQYIDLFKAMIKQK